MSRLRLAAALAAMIVAPLVAAPAGAQQRTDTFTWEGRVPSGRWLYLRNINGEVRIERGSGDRVEVTAVKRWRRGNPDDVRITTEKADDGEGLVVCALWNDDRSCDQSGYHGSSSRRSWSNDSDVSVHFTVRVPAGVRVDASTTNGGMSVVGATSEVVARTTNGDVRAESSGGPVSARTTNGNVTARMRELGDRTRDLDFSTTNGSVVVEVPASLSAEVDMSTTNGHVASDFPMTLSGRIDPRHLRATIGDGARRVRLRSTNGNVELRRGS